MPFFALLASVAIATARPVQAQDSTQSNNSRLGVLPILGSAPETGLQYGLTVFRVYRPSADSVTRPSVDQLAASNTARGQRKASFQTERWTEGNHWRLRARLEYQDYPLPFFGIGSSTPSEAEERYRATGAAIHLQAHRRLRSATYLLTGYRFSHTTIGDLTPGSSLASGQVTGSAGGNLSQLQGGLVRDSRDNIFSPHSGVLAQVVVTTSQAALGSDFSFTRLDVDLREYSRLKGFVIASQLQFSSTNGATPFDQLPSIGADTAIRGYTRGRFRDQQLLSGQVELRTPTWRRLGVVAFTGVGVVTQDSTGLIDTLWHPSVGAGLRYILFRQERNAVRIDFAKGRRSSGLYIGLNEAF
ncbi:MAG: BamA/TamA family outer membrane protein [Gemmatimonadaceae bacterium]